jgi:hypothetical protein
MIEHVNTTRELFIGSAKEEAKRLHSWFYYFPGAVLLDITYRIRASQPQGEIPDRTERLFTALQLTFGNGNPPDFGTGSLQTVLLKQPPEISPLRRYEVEQIAATFSIAVAKATKTTLEDKIGGLETQHARATEAQTIAETTYTEIKAKGEPVATHEAERAMIEARQTAQALEGQIKEARAELTGVNESVNAAEFALADLIAPSPWFAPVTGSFQRNFDALRLTPIIPVNEETEGPQIKVLLEEDLTVYRAQDLGATPIVPVTTAGRG